MILWLVACRPSVPEVGGFRVALDHDAGRFSLTGPSGARLDNVVLRTGRATARDAVRRIPRHRRDRAIPAVRGVRAGRGRRGPGVRAGRDAGGSRLGELVLADGEHRPHAWHFVAGPSAHDRIGLVGRLRPDDHFLGLGRHASTWTTSARRSRSGSASPASGSPPTDDVPGDWPLDGTRHATSYPVPFLLRPAPPATGCCSTPRRAGRRRPVRRRPRALRARRLARRARACVVLIAGARPLGAVRRLTDDWPGAPARRRRGCSAPWGDAIRGPERVRDGARRAARQRRPRDRDLVARTGRARATPRTGYRLDEEWFVDRDEVPRRRRGSRPSSRPTA